MHSTDLSVNGYMPHKNTLYERSVKNINGFYLQTLTGAF